MIGIGLEKKLIDQFDYELSFKRILRDNYSDFIFAPHYSIIFEQASDELFNQLKTKLLSGTYAARLPISINVIKYNGFSRNGSILEPIDRLAYQLVVDSIARDAENQIDRTQVFSNVLLAEDPDGQMFEKSGKAYKNFKERTILLCKNGKYSYVLKADVASFFDKIYQHNIGNLLNSSGAENNYVSFLEKLLLQFRQNDSHGILQGICTSDLLGNFSLCDIDAQHSINNIEFSRYMDDMCIFFQTLNEAKVHKVRLGNWLRNDGLTLNEGKTKIFAVKDLINEEGELELLFENARKEIIGRTIDFNEYGTSIIWDLETGLSYEEEYNQKDLKLEATKKLFDTAEGSSSKSKIEKYCLSIFATFTSEYAVQAILKGFSKEPASSQIYFGYLRKMIISNNVSSQEIEELLEQKDLLFDFQKKWIYSLILYLPEVSSDTLTLAMIDLQTPDKNIALRAICAIIIGKYGSSALRRVLKTHYQSENSEYVKSAILFAAQYFSKHDRDTCYKAWSGHSETNSLIVRALKKSNESSSKN